MYLLRRRPARHSTGARLLGVGRAHQPSPRWRWASRRLRSSDSLLGGLAAERSPFSAQVLRLGAAIGLALVRARRRRRACCASASSRWRRRRRTTSARAGCGMACIDSRSGRPFGLSPDRPRAGEHALRGRRLRQHPDAAAAAADPEARTCRWPPPARCRCAFSSPTRCRSSGSATSPIAGARALLLVSGPLRGGRVLPFVGLAPSVVGARRRPRSSAAWAVRRFIRRPPRSSIGTAGRGAGSRCRSTSRAARSVRRWRRWSLRRSPNASACARLPFLIVPALAGAAVRLLRADSAGRAAARAWHERRASRAAPVRQTADAALSDRRAANADGDQLRDVRPGDADAPRPDACRRRAPPRRSIWSRSGSAASSAVRWPTGSAPRRIIMLSLVAAVPFLALAPWLLRRRRSWLCWRSAGFCCSPPCRSTSPSRSRSRRSAPRPCRR